MAAAVPDSDCPRESRFIEDVHLSAPNCFRAEGSNVKGVKDFGLKAKARI